jgi:hypothetical protein
MKTPIKCGTAVVWALAVLSWAACAAAAQSVYPAQGQSVGLQAHDEAECSSWAVQQSGFDPSTPPPPSVAPNSQVTGSGARVAGAAGGAAIGAVAGNAGAGALAGAAAGGLIRRAKNRAAADQANALNAQRYQASRSGYDQARAACLTGRGYSVR